uniref:Uncharacterized protein n=1 Tax=Amphimedon queenslandica TaxID=400682 RepID=A0A1X7T1Q2_AMPQE
MNTRAKGASVSSQCTGKSGGDFSRQIHTLNMEVQNCNKEVQLYNGAESDRGKPTYGELIDLFEEALDSDDLCAKFKIRYPEMKIGRRFYDTVSRIAAPTKPSLTGKCSITGTQLLTYRRRTWEPRIRNDS